MKTQHSQNIRKKYGFGFFEVMKIKVDYGDSWIYDYTKNHWEIIYFIWIKYMGCEFSLKAIF